MATIQELSAKLEGAQRSLVMHQKDLEVAQQQVSLYTERVQLCQAKVIAATTDVQQAEQQLREVFMGDDNANL